jgi:hypothetical protein
MAAVAYIAANAPNDDEHMQQLRSLALEGVRVLQSTNKQGRDTTPRRNIPTAEQSRHQAAAPTVAPRPQVVEPINGELRHGLAQHRVDLARAQHEAHHIESEGEQERFSDRNHGIYGAECFSIFIRSTLLPKGIKLSNDIIKFNGQ